MLHSASAKHIRAIKAFSPPAGGPEQNNNNYLHNMKNSDIMIEEYVVDIESNQNNRSENFQQSDDEHGF